MKSQTLIFFVLVCILAEAVACASVAPTPSSVDESTADLVGQILEIYQAGPSGTENDQLGAILVKGVMQGGAQDALVTVAITEGTQLWQEEGQVRQPVNFDSLTVDQRVLITFRGPVAESYPMQAAAGEVVVTE